MIISLEGVVGFELFFYTQLERSVICESLEKIIAEVFGKEQSEKEFRRVKDAVYLNPGYFDIALFDEDDDDDRETYIDYICREFMVNVNTCLDIDFIIKTFYEIGIYKFFQVVKRCFEVFEGDFLFLDICGNEFVNKSSRGIFVNHNWKSYKFEFPFDELGVEFTVIETKY